MIIAFLCTLLKSILHINFTEQMSLNLSLCLISSTDVLILITGRVFRALGPLSPDSHVVMATAMTIDELPAYTDVYTVAIGMLYLISTN